ARIRGKDLCQIYAMAVGDTYACFCDLVEAYRHDQAISLLLGEIVSRLQYLVDVGLDYLTLERQSRTLSGGEVQRVNLTTAVGSSLTGTLYVLDEPSVGLHPRDTERLVRTLRALRDRGNTLVVVEHDAEIMRAADRLIDLGPGAGKAGGDVVFDGIPPRPGERVPERSRTARFLAGEEAIPIPARR